MRTVVGVIFPICLSFGQAFDVASVKLSPQTLGKDVVRPISIGPAEISGRNITLKRLIVEAYGLQPHQVSGGPNWLDQNEYDINAKADAPTTKDQLRLMLRTLLTDRFRLSLHTESKELRVYELVIDKNGPKIHAAETTGVGPHSFHGDLQQFANLLSIQLTLPILDDPTKPGIASGSPAPVVDKTGLSGIYDINLDMRPEIGVDMFTLWQRFLQSQLGLKLESRKAKVEVLVVDHAERIPIAN